MAKTTHIVTISAPAFSHEASMIEFCKRLVSLHNHFHVTCIFPTIVAPIQATLTLLDSLPPTIHCTFLPPLKKEDLPQNVPPIILCQFAVKKSMPSFHDELRALSSSTPLAALIADPFSNEALEIAKEFNLLSFIYFPPSAMTLSLFLYLPTVHEEFLKGARKQTEVINLPGCVPIHFHDLPDDFKDRSSLAYELILQRAKRFSLADGFLVNTFSKIEEGTIKALEEYNNSNNNVTLLLMVGPIIQTGQGSESNGSESLRWLENQKPNSVLYVSFGSEGAISHEQINELALGLELSGQKFLWVLRAPSDSANVALHSIANDDPLKFLPNGFLERTKEQGLVVPFWAPQTKILSHSATGGFLTHCGWNSTLESIVLGVPMITWPLYAEQRMNSVLLNNGLKVALRLKFKENGIAEREEIAKVIKDLMVGDERNGICQRIEEFKGAAADALKEDGSSARALSQFGSRIQDHLSN